MAQKSHKLKRVAIATMRGQIHQQLLREKQKKCVNFSVFVMANNARVATRTLLLCWSSHAVPFACMYT